MMMTSQMTEMIYLQQILLLLITLLFYNFKFLIILQQQKQQPKQQQEQQIQYLLLLLIIQLVFMIKSLLLQQQQLVVLIKFKHVLQQQQQFSQLLQLAFVVQNHNDDDNNDNDACNDYPFNPLNSLQQQQHQQQFNFNDFKTPLVFFNHNIIDELQKTFWLIFEIINNIILHIHNNNASNSNIINFFNNYYKFKFVYFRIISLLVFDSFLDRKCIINNEIFLGITINKNFFKFLKEFSCKPLKISANFMTKNKLSSRIFLE